MLIRNRNKTKNATGSDIISGLFGENGLKTDVSVELLPSTVILAVVGVVAAVGLSVVAFYYIKKSFK
jgi:hypothetical protein